MVYAKSFFPQKQLNFTELEPSRRGKPDILQQIRYGRVTLNIYRTCQKVCYDVVAFNVQLEACGKVTQHYYTRWSMSHCGGV